MSVKSFQSTPVLIDSLQAGKVSIRNRLLAALSPEDVSLLQPQLEPVPLLVRTCLVEPNTPIEHVYFLEEGIASVVVATPQGRRIEVGIIGREGMTGTSVLLGTDRTPHECFVQTPGNALRIGVDNLQRAVAASALLHQHLLRFVQAFTIQMGQTALSNGSHVLEQRLARWLLMCHDRVDGDDLSATHEFLSLMLGVRRAGVTETLKTLEDRGLIYTKRGQVTVLDRAKLETVAGDSYGVAEAEYARLIGLPEIARARSHIALSRVRAEELAAMSRLHELSSRLTAPPDLPPLLYEVLDATMALQRADFGDIQLFNAKEGTLEIVAQRGFRQEFLDYFQTVDASDTSACGLALKNSSRIIIEDVKTDPSFAPHKAIAASTGFRAVQSTPLFDRVQGAPVGMLSTHFRRPHRPSERDLHLTDLYARQAADVIAFRLAWQQP